jgi:hypothetical protein
MIKFSRKEKVLIFIASMCISFGITIPFGIILFLYIIIKKINTLTMKYTEEKFSTLFRN